MGFLWGWAMFWVMHSGIIAALAVVLGRYSGAFVPLDDGGIRAAAIAVIWLLSAINYAGVTHGSAVQAAFTIVKVGVVLVMIALAFTLGGSLPASAASPASPASPAFASFGLATAAGLFAYGGWHMVTYTAEETLEPERTIPRALVIGVLLVTACYVPILRRISRRSRRRPTVRSALRATMPATARRRGSGAWRERGPGAGGVTKGGALPHVRRALPLSSPVCCQPSRVSANRSTNSRSWRWPRCSARACSPASRHASIP